MNILCVEQFSEFGGGQRSLLDLLPAFFQQKWEPHVLLPDNGSFHAALRQLGCPTSSLGSGTYSSIRKPLNEQLRYARELPRVIKKIDALVQQHRFDLLYVNGPRFLPAAAVVAMRRNVPIIFHCHSRLLQGSAIAVTGFSLRLSRAKVIACCRHVSEPLASYVHPRNLSIVYNGLGQPSLRTVPLSRPIRKIGVLGRIEPEKGQIDFVRAARIVCREIPDCRFYIAGAPLFSGSSYYNEVVHEAHGLPVSFLGWQTDVGQVLSSLDLLVVPSTPFEATTRVILEAYSVGRPVVAFRCGGIPEILQDGETGFLAAAGTPAALAARILSVLRMEPADVEAVVQEAKAVWRRKYNLGVYQRQVCDLIAETALVDAFENRTAQA